MEEILELPRVPIGEWVERLVEDILRDDLGFIFDGIRAFFGFQIEVLEAIFNFPPPLIFILIAAAIAYWLRGWGFALYTVVAFGIIDSMGLWTATMDTFALIIVAGFYAILLGIPGGIINARNRTVSTLVRPILDFMQTLPVFVYIIPAIILFSIGAVPGMVAALIFSLPPAVRLTELGIRGVDEEVVEAAEAFGSGQNRTLKRVQMPLALPAIMQGVNQVIMLALSMVVVAGLIGAGGLGREVVRGVSRVDLDIGFEAGLAVVFLAIFLDRITSVVGQGGVGGGRARRRALKLAEMAQASRSTSTASDDSTADATEAQTEGTGAEGRIPGQQPGQS